MSAAIYRELEDGTRKPAWETWDPICKAFGWPQTFVVNVGSSQSTGS